MAKLCGETYIFRVPRGPKLDDRTYICDEKPDIPRSLIL